MLDKIREWILSLLRILFPEDVLTLIRQAGEDSGGISQGDGAGGNGSSGRGSGSEELSEEERRRMSQTPVERRHIVFYGRVQGVGFRYQAMYAARNYELTGWVANLSDGTVEMEIQGPGELIDHALLSLENGRWIRIEAKESERIPVKEGERGFHVRGY